MLYCNCNLRNFSELHSRINRFFLSYTSSHKSLSNLHYSIEVCFREIALEILRQEPIGAFMVRESTSKPCFALSLRVPTDFQPSGIAHYLILRTTKGYKIKVIMSNRYTYAICMPIRNNSKTAQIYQNRIIFSFQERSLTRKSESTQKCW